jgi:hypothetical protein
MKIKRVFDALSCQGDLYDHMNKLTESKIIREEVYVYVSEVYDPEHPLVLDA